MARGPVRSTARSLALGLAVAGLAGAACGDGEASGGGAEAAAEAADTVCALLRGWNDELGEVLDTTSRAITDADDPATANGVLLGGFDMMIATAEAHVAEVDGLELPDLPDRPALLAELREGAEESVAVLEEERAEVAELGPIGVEQQAGALGGAFTGVERATSALEPRVGAYDEQLREAFADDLRCRHVVQPT